MMTWRLHTAKADDEDGLYIYIYSSRTCQLKSKDKQTRPAAADEMFDFRASFYLYK
jgi:hypothetical protein